MLTYQEHIETGRNSYVEPTILSERHGVQTTKWGGIVSKRGLSRLLWHDTGRVGMVKVRVELHSGKAGAIVEGHTGHHGSPMTTSEVRALADMLTRAADAMEEFEAPEKGGA